MLKANGTGWDVVTETSVTRTPIGVLETTSNGWRDPFVTVSGGGMPVDASGGEVLIAAEDEGEVLE